jgi:hypothetical protein
MDSAARYGTFPCMRKLSAVLLAGAVAFTLTGCAEGESPVDAINGVVDDFKEIPGDTANKVALAAAGAAYRGVQAASAFDGGVVTDTLIDNVLSTETPGGYVYDPASNQLSFRTPDGSTGIAYVCVTGEQAEPC